MRRVWRLRPYEPTPAEIEQFDSAISLYLAAVRDRASDQALLDLIDKIGVHADRVPVQVQFDDPIPHVELRGHEALARLRSRLTGVKL